MNTKDIPVVLLLAAASVLVLWLRAPSMFRYRFSPALIERYERSQDIPHEVRNRVFLSDSDIHIAAGYLYTGGFSPESFNFQHPPLIKYLFGWSTRLTGSPFTVQILLAALFVSLSYAFARRSLDIVPAAAAAGLILIDPVFVDVSSQALLDLGQSVCAVAYVLVATTMPGAWVFAGILLGLFAASKFWTTACLFYLAVTGYQIWLRKMSYRTAVLTGLVACATFAAVYARAFAAHGGFFNIVFFQLKLLKYWLHHSVTSMPAASVILFLTGYVWEWWGAHTWVRAQVWTPVWPAALACSLFTPRTAVHLFIVGMPLVFLAYLGAQAPFTRYFLIILPFLYTGFIMSVLNAIRKR